jgi:ABC-type Fe3+-siderophore transport system permease subunit
MRYRRNAVYLLAMLSGALVIVLTLSLGMGAVAIPPGQVLSIIAQQLTHAPAASSAEATIVWDFRLARALLAVCIGAGLAVAGATYQSLFRNPLADPFIIGASGGASLGAALAIITGVGPVMLLAFAGAVAAVILVYAIAESSGGRSSTVHLVLAGAALSTLLSSAVSLLMFLYDRNLHEIFAWLMGGLGGRSWPHLYSTAPVILIGSMGLWTLARPLDALTCGEEAAQSLGLDIQRTRVLIVGLSALVTAAAVSTSGIIGFVGLLAPHAARMLVGGAHQRLIPTSALIGGLLLLLADDLARTVAAPVELPIGILMSLLGAPFFLWLLRRGWKAI